MKFPLLGSASAVAEAISVFSHQLKTEGRSFAYVPTGELAESKSGLTPVDILASGKVVGEIVLQEVPGGSIFTLWAKKSELEDLRPALNELYNELTYQGWIEAADSEPAEELTRTLGRPRNSAHEWARVEVHLKGRDQWDVYPEWYEILEGREDYADPKDLFKKIIALPPR